jgi:hypothetical protein
LISTFPPIALRPFSASISWIKTSHNIIYVHINMTITSDIMWYDVI